MENQLHLAIDQHPVCPNTAGVNSDLGKGSFCLFWGENRDAKHVDRCRWKSIWFDRINWPLTSRDVYFFGNACIGLVWKQFRCLRLSQDSDLSGGPRGTTATSALVRFYYRKRGSASYIVRQWLLWEGERERETPVTSLISRWNREWSCIWLPRRRVDPTRRRVLTLSLSSARTSKCMHVKTRSLALGSSRVEWSMNDDGEVEALRSLVRLPWITQQYFVGMLQTRRIDQVDVYFLFEWPWFYLWEQLG